MVCRYYKEMFNANCKSFSITFHYILHSITIFPTVKHFFFSFTLYKALKFSLFIAKLLWRPMLKKSRDQNLPSWITDAIQTLPSSFRIGEFFLKTGPPSTQSNKLTSPSDATQFERIYIIIRAF
jgi:hypothetical protein